MHVRRYHENKDPLTPNHLLIGRAFPNVPVCIQREPFYEDEKLDADQTPTGSNMEEAGTRILAYSERLKEVTYPESKPDVNDVVWVLEEWIPRGIWPLGRVARTFSGPD